MTTNAAGFYVSIIALVMPAAVAFLFTSRFVTALVVAWVVGSVALVAGVVASFMWDIATGPLLVCTYGAALVIASLVRWWTGVRPGSTLKA